MTESNGGNRKPKRERKKQARDARREEWKRAVAKRRRQRWGVLLGSLAVIGAGLLIAWVALKPDSEPKQPTASDAADTIESLRNEPVACDADLPKAAGSTKKQYAKAKDQNLDEDTTYIWHLETSCGDIDIELDLEASPKTANSIVFLTKEKFYDGLLFHRLIKDFVIQGGDPQGDGQGGPGYDVVDPPADDLKYEVGSVAMAKTQTDPEGTSGSQFYIVTGKDGASLPPQYALLGKVTDGMDAVDDIEALAGESDTVPSAWAYIERATIIER